MANKDEQKKESVQQGGPRANRRQAPKMKVIESGKAEQEAPIGAAGKQLSGERSARKALVRKKEREEYRYGGIPIGSDPRE
jgi:hypothetical protein